MAVRDVETLSVARMVLLVQPVCHSDATNVRIYTITTNKTTTSNATMTDHPPETIAKASNTLNKVYSVETDKGDNNIPPNSPCASS